MKNKIRTNRDDNIGAMFLTIISSLVLYVVILLINKTGLINDIITDLVYWIIAISAVFRLLYLSIEGSYPLNKRK